MPDPRQTLKASNNARIEIRAPEALLDEIRETAQAHGRTQSDVIRVAVHCLHLADRFDATFDPKAVEMMSGDQAETLVSLRRSYLREANELIEGLMPNLGAVIRERFLSFVVAEAADGKTA